MLKKVLFGIGLAGLAIAILPTVAAAQTRSNQATDRVRVFGGFSYLRFTASGNEEVAMLRQDTFGLQGNLTYYFHRRIGFMVDGAFNTGSILPDEVPEGVDSADLTQTSLLFGPNFVISNPGQTLTVTGYATIGWATGSIDVRGVNEAALPVFRRLDQSVLASSIGAQFDVMIGDGGWGVRVAQLEVLIAGYDETLTNFRYSGGIVGSF